MVVTEKEIRDFETGLLAGSQWKGRLRPAQDLPDLATCDQLGRPYVVWLEVGVPAFKNRPRFGQSDFGPCIKTGQHVVKSSPSGVHMWEDRKTKEVEALHGLFSAEEGLEAWFDERKWLVERQAIIHDIRETNKKEKPTPKSPPERNERKLNAEDAEPSPASRGPKSPMLLGPADRKPTLNIPDQQPAAPMENKGFPGTELPDKIEAESEPELLEQKNSPTVVDQPSLKLELPDDIEPESETEQQSSTTVMNQMLPRVQLPDDGKVEVKIEPEPAEKETASVRQGSRGRASTIESRSEGGTYSSLSNEENSTSWPRVSGPFSTFGATPSYGMQAGVYTASGYLPGAVPYNPMPPGAMPPPRMGQPIGMQPPASAPSPAPMSGMPHPAMRQPPAISEPPPAPVRLRLLITASVNKQYCFSRRVLQIFSKHLDLSMEHVMMLNGYISKGDFLSWNDGEHEAYLVRYSLGPGIPRDPVLVCRHNSSTGVTNALLILNEPYKFRSDGAWYQSIVSTITDRCAFANDPFLASAAICKYVHDYHFNSWCGANEAQLQKLRDELQLKTKSFDPLENDFISGTKIIQRLQECLAESCGPIQANEILIKRLRHASTKAAIKGDEQMLVDPYNPFSPLKERGKGRAEGAELLMIDCEFESKRLLDTFARHTLNLQSIQQLVSNYMTIKEARVNGELARSSMEIAKVTARDSSAMKSIAVLTMVFLPATAVAAIFDTPFFEWTSDGEDGRFTTRNFSTYWNITGPLTVAVMIIWFLLVRPQKEWREKSLNQYKKWKDAYLPVLRKWRAGVSGEKPEDLEKRAAYISANQDAFNNNAYMHTGKPCAVNQDPRAWPIDYIDISGPPGQNGENWQTHVTGTAGLSGWKYFDETVKNVVDYIAGKRGGDDSERPIPPQDDPQPTESELEMGSMRVEFDGRPDEPKRLPAEARGSRRKNRSSDVDKPGPKTITEWGEMESAPQSDESLRRRRSLDSELANSDSDATRGKAKESTAFTMPNRKTSRTTEELEKAFKECFGYTPRKGSPESRSSSGRPRRGRRRPFVPVRGYVPPPRRFNDGLNDLGLSESLVEASKRRETAIGLNGHSRPGRSTSRRPASRGRPIRRFPLTKPAQWDGPIESSASRKPNVPGTPFPGSPRESSPYVRLSGPLRRGPGKAPAMPRRPSWSDAKYNNDMKNFDLFNEDTAKWFAAKNSLEGDSFERRTDANLSFDPEPTSRPSSARRGSPPVRRPKPDSSLEAEPTTRSSSARSPSPPTRRPTGDSELNNDVPVERSRSRRRPAKGTAPSESGTTTDGDNSSDDQVHTWDTIYSNIDHGFDSRLGPQPRAPRRPGTTRDPSLEREISRERRSQKPSRYEARRGQPRPEVHMEGRRTGVNLNDPYYHAFAPQPSIFWQPDKPGLSMPRNYVPGGGYGFPPPGPAMPLGVGGYGMPPPGQAYPPSFAAYPAGYRFPPTPGDNGYPPYPKHWRFTEGPAQERFAGLNAQEATQRYMHFRDRPDFRGTPEETPFDRRPTNSGRPNPYSRQYTARHGLRPASPSQPGRSARDKQPETRSTNTRQTNDYNVSEGATGDFKTHSSTSYTSGSDSDDTWEILYSSDLENDYNPEIKRRPPRRTGTGSVDGLRFGPPTRVPTGRTGWTGSVD